MSSSAADGPDTDTVIQIMSQQASSPSSQSIKPDQISLDFVDALEKPLPETDNKSLGSARATSGQSKSSESSNVSFTSTIEYGQTPFDQYVHQVRELCHLLWPSSPKVSQDIRTSRVERLLARNRVAEMLLPKRSRAAQTVAPPKEFLIHRLRSGGYNRILGITIKHSSDEEPVELILRVPRFEDVRHDREVAILRFVRQYTTIPLPEVKYVDFSRDNPLKQCYMIQNRIPGHDLQQNKDFPTCYLNLSHEQKCTFAREFALILLKLNDLRHPFPGIIEASIDPNNNNRDYTVRHLELESISGYEPELDLNTKLPFFQARPFVKDWVPSEATPFEQTTYYFMIAQFGRWKALELRCDPATISWCNDYDRLVTMARQMDELGFLGDDENCFCHLDLLGAPRNIMVDIKPDGSLSITGILDWDSAVFAPRFVGCAPPMWLWAWSEEDDEDERHANDTPSTLENQEIKRIFEETVGDKSLSYAYKPEYRLARDLFRFAHSGIRSSTDIGEVSKLLEDWAEICDSRMADKEKTPTIIEDGATANASEGEINRSTEAKTSE